MTDEDLILVFELLIQNKEKPLFEAELYKLVNPELIDWSDFNVIIRHFWDSEYTERKNGIIINDFGIKEYKKLKEQLKDSKLKAARLEQKENFDFNISKFQSEHRFLPYIISGLSLIVSIFALFKGCELKQPQKTQEQVIEKPLIEYKNDSLHNSTSKIDSLNIR